jgi:chemotaxis protein CheD
MSALQLPVDAAGTMPEITRERRFLQPGQLVVTDQPTAITTILGSCVAVCMWDPNRRVGGMNHYMLPLQAGGSASSPRFGLPAMEELLARLRTLGARLPLLQARVYGGACMFPGMQTTQHLGTQNAELALNFLKTRHIDLVDVAVGGNRGRKVIFNTDEGSVCLTSI